MDRDGNGSPGRPGAKGGLHSRAVLDIRNAYWFQPEAPRISATQNSSLISTDGFLQTMTRSFGIRIFATIVALLVAVAAITYWNLPRVKLTRAITADYGRVTFDESGNLYSVQGAQWDDAQIEEVVKTILRHRASPSKFTIAESSLVTDRGVASISELRQLKELMLDLFCRMTGEGLQDIGKLTSLEVLILPDCDLRHGLGNLSGLKHLRSLNLTGCKLTEADVVAIGKFDSLTDLDLSFIEVVGTRMDFLHSLSHLERLNLRSTGNSDEGLAVLTGAKELRELDISGNSDVTNASIAVFQTLPALKRLSVRGTQIDIELLRQRLPHCELPWPSLPKMWPNS